MIEPGNQSALYRHLSHNRVNARYPKSSIKPVALTEAEHDHLTLVRPRHPLPLLRGHFATDAAPPDAAPDRRKRRKKHLSAGTNQKSVRFNIGSTDFAPDTAFMSCVLCLGLRNPWPHLSSKPREKHPKFGLSTGSRRTQNLEKNIVRKHDQNQVFK